MTRPIIPYRVPLSVKELNHNISLSVKELNHNVSLSTDSVINVTVYDADKYEGEYIVTPLAFTDQELETKDKVLTDNVVVLKVPKYETSNVSGGKTVYIAEV